MPGSMHEAQQLMDSFTTAGMAPEFLTHHLACICRFMLTVDHFNALKSSLDVEARSISCMFLYFYI